MSFSGFFPPTFDLSSEEAMTRRPHENLVLDGCARRRVVAVGVAQLEKPS
jgi:hypothetical protein